MPFLFAFREDRFGFRFEMGDRAVIGRSPESDLIVFDPAVSRLHTEIVRGDNGYIIRDMGSSNGTFYNGSQVEADILIKKNGEIKIGEEIFLFDPDLDVAVGREGVALIVGDVEEEPDGKIVGKPEPNLGMLDKGTLAALLKIATALARFSSISMVIKQTVYVLEKLLEAETIAILWPEGATGERLTSLAIRPEEQHVIIPQPIVKHSLEDGNPVLWPKTFTELTFIDGERTISELESSSLSVPLVQKGKPSGLIYITSNKRSYGEKELNVLTALAGMVSPAIANTRLIGELMHRASREEEAFKGRVRLIGEHQQTKALRAMAAQAAQSDERILIEGEEGTGKEILAEFIHSQSGRKNSRFIPINCASIAQSELDREIFGQEAGSVGEEDWPGLLEEAEGGTVFIHNIHFLAEADQSKLLQAMEEGVIYRVGSFRPRPVNFRLITSTDEDLKKLADNEEFREDLYLRISEFTLVTYPLRELSEDIILLAKHFLDQEARALGQQVPELDPAVEECLRSYNWPGNSGELRNVIERIMMFQQGDRIMLEDLPLDLRLASEAFKVSVGERSSESVIEVEKDLIRKALSRTDGDRRMAAKLLGISYDELDERIRGYDIFLEQTVVMEIT